MRKYILPALVSIAIVGCNTMAQNGSSDSSVEGSDKEVSYALGVSIGENLASQGFDNLDYSELAKGLKEAKAGTATMDSKSAQALIQQYQQDLKSAKYGVNLKKSEDFLAENGKKEGVLTTASGLQYKIVKEGTGASPTTSDKVTVHYTGTLLDGTKFDSSRDRGEPSTFGVTQVIKGWTEGLQIMKEGAVYEFYIHPDMAYGVNPRGGTIQPNDALVFNVELIKVN